MWAAGVSLWEREIQTPRRSEERAALPPRVVAEFNFPNDKIGAMGRGWGMAGCYHGYSLACSCTPTHSVQLLF